MAGERRRPVGLVILATIQFVLAAAVLFALARAPIFTGAYAVLSPLITGIAMVVTEIGYLKVRWGLGFIGGNLLALASLTNILVYNAIEGFVNLPLHLPSMVYPLVLLACLNLRYKPAFTESRQAA